MATSAPAAELRSVESGVVIKGVVTLLFTPFQDDATRFDAASMRRQLDFVLESGVSALVACGKAGEFEGQTLEEIEEVLGTVIDHVAGRVPVEVLNLPPHTDTPEVGLNRIMVTEEENARTFSIRALPGAQPLEQLIYVSGIVETRSPQPTSFTAEPIVLKIVEKAGGAAGGE